MEQRENQVKETRAQNAARWEWINAAVKEGHMIGDAQAKSIEMVLDGTAPWMPARQRAPQPERQSSHRYFPEAKRREKRIVK